MKDLPDVGGIRQLAVELERPPERSLRVVLASQSIHRHAKVILHGGVAAHGLGRLDEQRPGARVLATLVMDEAQGVQNGRRVGDLAKRRRILCVETAEKPSADRFQTLFLPGEPFLARIRAAPGPERLPESTSEIDAINLSRHPTCSERA